MALINNIIEAVNMISQLQSAKAAMGTPVSAWKAYKILFGSKK